MQTTYDGSNSVIFDDVDSWEAWGFVPTSRPTVSLPEVRKNVLEIPGTNGVLDLSEVPLGYPTFGNRSGSWSFAIAHDVISQPLDTVLSRVFAAIHGRNVKCVLKEDNSYFYRGRLSISNLSTGNIYTTITIDYDLEPFKRMIWTTTEDWLWNPFDFVNGVILQSSFKDIPVTAEEWVSKSYSQDFIGMEPVSPTFYVTPSSAGASITLRVQNTGISDVIKEFTLDGTAGSDGSFAVNNPLIEFSCPTPSSKTNIQLRGNGLVSIDFRPGRL